MVVERYFVVVGVVVVVVVVGWKGELLEEELDEGLEVVGESGSDCGHCVCEVKLRT